MKRIALIHALPHSIAPINEAFERLWPEALRTHLLDDSLSRDLARSPSGLDPAMHARFQQLAQYVVDCGADAILFTCSAFGPCIEAVARRHPQIPVAKPNEAMVAQAAALGGRIGLVATFEATLRSMPREFPAQVALECALAPGALEALNDGDPSTHDRLIAEQALRLQSLGCTAIALAQFSMARAQAACRAATRVPILTPVDAAVQDLRGRLM